jgi:hypothetical protein
MIGVPTSYCRKVATMKNDLLHCTFKRHHLVLLLSVVACMTTIVDTAHAASSTPTVAYSAARRIWKAAVCDNAAEQSGTGGAWWRAASDLTRASPEPRSYKVAAGRLRNLALVPETGATPRQMEEAGSDLKNLDGFFHTPDWYLTLPRACPLS